MPSDIADSSSLERLLESIRADDVGLARMLLEHDPALKAKLNEPIGPFDSPALSGAEPRHGGPAAGCRRGHRRQEPVVGRRFRLPAHGRSGTCRVRRRAGPPWTFMPRRDSACWIGSKNCSRTIRQPCMRVAAMVRPRSTSPARLRSRPTCLIGAGHRRARYRPRIHAGAVDGRRAPGCRPIPGGAWLRDGHPAGSGSR